MITRNSIIINSFDINNYNYIYKYMYLL